jgi:uncharacterized protein DUF402
VTWAPGDVVMLREVWEGQLIAVRPVNVVRDDPHDRAFFLPRGTKWKDDPRAHGEVRFREDPWELEDRVVARPVLSFAFRDLHYAVLLTWSAEDVFQGYYVNLQSPLWPWEGGFDYVDHFLDVVIAPDQSSWTWKDEDDLAEAVRRGLLASEAVARVRLWGERAVEHVLLRQPPFDREWSNWRPDPTWPAPVLSEGWDRPPATG